MRTEQDQRRPAVVLLSGGLDSATTLAIAREAGFDCHALSFDYGQRHSFEIDAALNVANAQNVADHRVLTIDLRAFGGSALTDDIDVPKDRDESAVGDDIPVTYVPARNTIFLSFALAFAETIEAADIFLGVNAVDYSGYPDCRPQFIEAFERMANLATRFGVEATEEHAHDSLHIHAPLIDLTKAQIIKRGVELGVDYGMTLSCYDPMQTQNGWKVCEHCDACRLRAVGFKDAGIDDPAIIPPECN